MQILGAAQDITDRKLAELALQESESKFRAVFNSALDAIAIVDDDGRYIDANSSACELFGVSKEELMGSSIADFAEPEFDFTQAWQSFREQGQLCGEFRLYRPDGIVREVEYAARTDFLPHRHLSILRDISERKRAEKTLQESTAQYRRIIETTLEGVWLIDAQSKTNFVNRQMAEMLGYTVDEMLGMPLFAFVAEEDRAIATDYTERRRQGIQERHDFKFRRQDGSDLWASLSTNAIFDDSGQYAGALAMVTDITERKRAEAEISLRNWELLTLHRVSEITLKTKLLSDAFAEIVEEISSATNFPIVAIELYDEARQMMVFAGVKGVPLSPDASVFEVPVDQTLSGTVARTGQLIAKTYLPQELKKCDACETLSQLGIRTFICVPMTVNQRVIGVLSLAHPETVQFNDLLRWIPSLANYVALLTDRKQAEEVLRQYERTVSATPDGVALVDRNYT